MIAPKALKPKTSVSAENDMNKKVHVGSETSKYKDSFYLRSQSASNLPAYFRFPLSDVVTTDPTNQCANYTGILYHGGVFPPRVAKAKGIMPFKSAMDNFNGRKQESSVYEYVKAAQERRVNGHVEADPFRSCSLSGSQAIRFAPRASTENKIPPGISKVIEDIYTKNKNFDSPPVSAKLNESFCYNTPKGEEIYIDLSCIWGAYSKPVIDRMVEIATDDLAKDVFGPNFGYLIAIETCRGHKLMYGAGGGAYQKEQEVNLFGGVQRNEIKAIIPVWGKYMNPFLNFIVHSKDLGCRDLELFAQQHILLLKNLLRNERLKNWREYASSFGNVAKFKSMISSLNSILCQDSITVVVAPLNTEKKSVKIHGIESFVSKDMLCDINLTIDTNDLPNGLHVLKCDASQLSDNKKAIEHLSSTLSEKRLELIKIDACRGVDKFINEYDDLSKLIPVDIF